MSAKDIVVEKSQKALESFDSLIENERLQKALKDPLVNSGAKILLGLGIIGTIVAFGPIPILELVTWALLVTLPILSLLWALGLIGTGTIELVMNGGLHNAIRTRVQQLKQAPA